MKAFNLYDLKKGLLGIHEKLFAGNRTNEPKKVVEYSTREYKGNVRKNKV